MTMNRYEIDYQYGKAVLFTPSEDWESRFIHLAMQCFGIRKSIGRVKLISEQKCWPRFQLKDEYERLCHNGDVTVWNEAGEKIKTEWDGWDQ